ncbi:MAG: hypothetical protein NTV03_03645, partial [Candidatus Nomurabacteria bacterium]|nr:hypothetical protein [Candidatus Nomurabacteria bacterium]
MDNKANNPPLCTTTNSTCQNGATNYPLCNNTTNLFPSVKVTAKPTSIKEGNTTVISWTSTKAVSCDAGAGNGKGTTGSFKTGVLTTNTSYSVVCIDAKGSKGSGNVYVTVSPNNISNTFPTIKVTAYPTVTECNDGKDNDKDGLIDIKDPNCHEENDLTKPYNAKSYSESSYKTVTPPNKPIAVGETSTISWTSTNTTSCDAGIGTSTNPNGSFITEALSESRSYTVTCKGDKGEVSSDAFVNVLDVYKFPVVTVTATPASVDSGKTSKISWTSTNATSCNAGIGRGTGTTGSFDTGPLVKTTSYTVTCIGPNGQKGGNTSVSINGGDNVLPEEPTIGKPQCSDDKDNNGNGLIDGKDPNCHAGGDIKATYDPTHDSESTPA